MAIATNIVHGAARLFVGATTATAPQFGDIADLLDGTFTGFTYAGATAGAVTLTETPAYRRVQADQSTNADVVLVTGVESTVSTEMLEVALELLERAFRAAADDDTTHDLITPAGVGQAPVVTLAIVGPWLDGQQALVVIERASQVSNSEIAFTREEETRVSVEFLALEPETAAAAVMVALGKD